MRKTEEPSEENPQETPGNGLDDGISIAYTYRGSDGRAYHVGCDFGTEEGGDCWVEMVRSEQGTYDVIRVSPTPSPEGQGSRGGGPQVRIEEGHPDTEGGDRGDRQAGGFGLGVDMHEERQTLDPAEVVEGLDSGSGPIRPVGVDLSRLETRRGKPAPPDGDEGLDDHGGAGPHEGRADPRVHKLDQGFDKRRIRKTNDGGKE